MKDDVLNDILGDDNEPSEEEDKILAPLLEEIDLIEDPGIMSFVRAILVRAPYYFWTAPSSFTGNYHPPDERGHGGGILHTKRVVRIAREMTIAQNKEEDDLDKITAAALLHDLTKGTQHPDGYIIYDPMHPYTVDAFVAWVMSEANISTDEMKSSTLWIRDEDMSTILRMIRCHMGAWSPIPETMPVSSQELTLHMADLLATKLHHIVDGNDIKPQRWEVQDDE